MYKPTRLVPSPAPSGNEILKPQDAVDVLEELLEAQNHSYVLGLKLKVPLHVVDAIHTSCAQPRERLLQVLIAFTQQVERPTWRTLVDTLRNPVLNMVSLARRVEAIHFPDPVATCEVIPETNTPPSTNTLPILPFISQP